MGKLLVLGLGNDILSDDAVGLNVVRELRRHLPVSSEIEIRESFEMGLALLDYLLGYDGAILVDAIQTGEATPGFLHEFNGCDLKVLPRISPHFLGVGEVLALAGSLGLPVPKRIRIFAIETADPFTVRERMTPALQRVFPGIVAKILAAVREMQVG